MKRIVVHFAIAFCLVWILACSSKKEQMSNSAPQWVEKLNNIPLPDYMQGDSLINVYFIYNQTVKGYEVTGRWMPYGKYSETGDVVINFHHKETGNEFHYFGKKYNSFDTDEVTFAKDFKGHQNGDIHYFNYASPDTIDNFKSSSINYYSSFQFLDVDFDGNDELLISDMCKGQAGNNYDVYKITKDGLQKVTYMPLDGLTNMDRIDLKNRTITIILNDGAYDEAEFYFSYKKRQEAVKDLPKFYSASASYFDFDKYNKELGSPFVLDSIKEYLKTDAERCVTYKVIGSRIVKEDELGNKYWSWNYDGRFKYPSNYKRSEEIFIEDVPASVEVISNGNVQLCYWPILGEWSTFSDFPQEGAWLSPTERVKNITYRAESKLIVSGYTQKGNIYYLSQKITYGGEVNHSKVLVLIYPPSEKKKVSTLLDIVKDW